MCIFERSLKESYATFCAVLSKFLTPEQNVILNDFMEQACKLEPEFTDHVYLNIYDVPKLMERIKTRGRDGEQYITPQFMSELNDEYKKFYDTRYDKLTPRDDVDIRHLKNQIYVIGCVAVGKTTFINTIRACVREVVSEPIKYWEPYLTMH